MPDQTAETIGANELMTAAYARHVDAVLVTNNEGDYRRVPGLSVKNWI